jgi:hypothetical protein
VAIGVQLRLRVDELAGLAGWELSMSGSGLIYAAVLGAWAVYFATRAMRSGPREVIVPTEGVVLRRRGTADAPVGTYSLIRPAVDAAEPVVKQRRPDTAVAAGPAPVRVSAATARRRRRMLVLLVLSSLSGGLLKLVGALPGWAAGLPVLLLLTYVGELRAQARRARAPRVVVEEPVAPVAPKRHGLRGRPKDSSDFFDPWPSFDPADSTPGRTSQLAEGWEPRPVPLPTYIMAAKAPSVVGRRIDIPAGRAWTEHDDPAADSTQAPAPAPVVEPLVAQTAEGAEAVAEATTKLDPSSPADEATGGETPIGDGLQAEFEHKRAVND